MTCCLLQGPKTPAARLHLNASVCSPLAAGSPLVVLQQEKQELLEAELQCQKTQWTQERLQFLELLCSKVCVCVVCVCLFGVCVCVCVCVCAVF